MNDKEAATYYYIRLYYWSPVGVLLVNLSLLDLNGVHENNGLASLDRNDSLGLAHSAIEPVVQGNKNIQIFSKNIRNI